MGYPAEGFQDLVHSVRILRAHLNDLPRLLNVCGALSSIRVSSAFVP